MAKKKKGVFFTFTMGMVAAFLTWPLLSALGIPSFGVVLIAIFGEGNPWAIVFSILLMVIVVFSVFKEHKREKQKGI